jgi:signal transduction histidine kinase
VDGRARRAQVTVERDASAASESSDGSGACVAAPRDALAQALLNLLINAISHTPAGGRVRLTASADAAQRVTIRVTDTGPGVPPAAREQIFDPFHTRGIGAGLGLAVVRRLARELGWQLGISDAAGGGACFQITLPAAGTGMAAADAAAAAGGCTATGAVTP